MYVLVQNGACKSAYRSIVHAFCIDAKQPVTDIERYICKNASTRPDVVAAAAEVDDASSSRSTFVNLILRAHHYLSTHFHSICSKSQTIGQMHCVPLSFVRSAPAVVKCESVGLFQHMYAKSESQMEKKWKSLRTSWLRYGWRFHSRPSSHCKSLKLWES